MYIVSLLFSLFRPGSTATLPPITFEKGGREREREREKGGNYLAHTENETRRGEMRERKKERNGTTTATRREREREGGRTGRRKITNSVDRDRGQQQHK